MYYNVTMQDVKDKFSALNLKEDFFLLINKTRLLVWRQNKEIYSLKLLAQKSIKIPFARLKLGFQKFTTICWNALHYFGSSFEAIVFAEPKDMLPSTLNVIREWHPLLMQLEVRQQQWQSICTFNEIQVVVNCSLPTASKYQSPTFHKIKH